MAQTYDTFDGDTRDLTTEMAQMHLESAARAIRAATHALDAAARASPVVARALDTIQGVDTVQIALAERIEKYAEEMAR